MVDTSNSERLGGFCNRQTDGQMDICYSRVAFATENEIYTHSNVFVSGFELIESSFENFNGTLLWHIHWFIRLLRPGSSIRVHDDSLLAR